MRYEGQPIEEVLRLAYATNLAKVSELGKSFEPPMSDWMAKHRVLVEDTVELERWVRPDDYTPEGRKRRVDKMIRMCDEARLPLEVTRLFVQAVRAKRGAPVKAGLRKLAVKALEAWRTNPDFSWMRFANAHCDCGKNRHDVYCKERIRQATMGLQDLLKRLHIEVKRVDLRRQPEAI